ncbi:hypothetical protein [Granulicella aggregans]|uniref:hypothetical protein n=1 Tax=Granulicella aggregans TaxID=474949 RepID=UPI0021E0DD31|nr:hypothetical protein [Granulicella aggregans]
MEIVRLLFSYNRSMGERALPVICDYVIGCKCRSEPIPAMVEIPPASWIGDDCPLCAARRHYFPQEIFQGQLSMRLIRKPVRSERELEVGEMKRAVAREEEARVRDRFVRRL